MAQRLGQHLLTAALFQATNQVSMWRAGQMHLVLLAAKRPLLHGPTWSAPLTTHWHEMVVLKVLLDSRHECHKHVPSEFQTNCMLFLRDPPNSIAQVPPPDIGRRLWTVHANLIGSGPCMVRTAATSAAVRPRPRRWSGSMSIWSPNSR
jgi:hypothetical protein